MQVQLQDGTTVEVINNSGEPAGQTFAGREDAIRSTQEALSRVTQFMSEAMQQFQKIEKPSEIEVEFGIEAGGEGGLFGIAKVHSKATITLRAKWVNS